MNDFRFDADRARAALYSELAARWSGAGISYAVASGLIPGKDAELGRDLDVLTEAGHARAASDHVVQAMEDLGWEVMLKRRPWTTMITGIADRGDTPFSVEIDIFSSLRWFNVQLVDGPQPDSVPQSALGLRFDPWASFAKRVLVQILGNQVSRLRRDSARARIRPSDGPVLEAPLARLFGTSLGRAVLDAVTRLDFAWMEANASWMRRVAATRNLRNRPVSAVVGTFAWLRNELHDRCFADRAAPILAVVGPDGTGKSSSIRALKTVLESRFRFEDVVVRHWRPGLLPPLRALGRDRARNDAPLPTPPRREPGRFGWLRLLYYGVDFALGHLLRDRRLASRLTPIIYDRCLLDMAVDPLRYGLSSGRGVRTLWQVLPGPDLVVFIDDDVDRILRRKPELEREELERQLVLWRDLASLGLVDRVVEAGPSPEATAVRLLDPLLVAFLALGDGRGDPSR
jgi:hypothetical protein